MDRSFLHPLSMSLPRIAIVGRPNVGKSSLFNRLVGRRVSIVEPTAGVTRDRVTVVMRHDGRRFELTDTGGLGMVDEEQLKDHIDAQIAVAMATADLILFVVDGKEGRVPGDDLVARRLRRLNKKLLLVANKVETWLEEQVIAEWLRLGFGEPIAVSARDGFGITDLFTELVTALPPKTDAEDEPDVEVLKFAIVGKRNSGKSTLINRLCGEDRVIVSEMPGTTRDAVDVEFQLGGRSLLAIDTAGVRKKKSVEHAIEMFSHARSTESIRRAQMVIHLFDVRDSVSQVDKSVAAYCVEHHKPVLLVGNKIDLAPDVDLKKWDTYMRQQLPGLDHAPIAFLSAKDGTNVGPVIELLFELQAQARTEMSTGRLNAVLQAARDKLLPQGRGRFPKLFYGTQIATDPITLLVFVNDPKLFDGQYERYLSQVLRDNFNCPEVPIRLIFRRRDKIVLSDRKA